MKNRAIIRRKQEYNTVPDIFKVVKLEYKEGEEYPYIYTVELLHKRCHKRAITFAVRPEMKKARANAYKLMWGYSPHSLE